MDIQKLVKYVKDKDLAIYDELQSLNDQIIAVTSVLAQLDLENLDFIKGEQGEEGKMGAPGPSGKDGKDGKDGRNGRDGSDGIDGRDGIDGKSAADVTGEELVAKLEALGDDAKLDAKAIKNLPTIKDIIKALKGLKGKDRLSMENINQPEKGPLDQRWGGHGGLFAKYTPADNVIPIGVANDVNQIFTLPNAPKDSSLILYLNGAFQTEGEDYTLVGTIITFVNPPQQGSVIRAFYRY